MKKLTINDATKEELIRYFFTPEGFGGGYRITAAEDKFLLWLQAKRNKELFDAQEVSIDESQKALHEYVELVKAMNNEVDIEKKLEIAEKANKAYKRYELAEKRNKSLDKKIKDSLDIDYL